MTEETPSYGPATQQPPPTRGRAEVLGYALRALMARAAVGKSRYGTLLMTENGRNALEDWYQEQCDAFMYATQYYLEQQGE